MVEELLSYTPQDLANLDILMQEMILEPKEIDDFHEKLPDTAKQFKEKRDK